jgi:Neocarzinostatin family
VADGHPYLHILIKFAVSRVSQRFNRDASLARTPQKGKSNMKHYSRIIATITLLLLALGTTAAHASPASGTITVTPNTGLSDGQTVQISGSGFRSNVVLNFGECGPVDTKPFNGGRHLALCSDSAVSAVTTDASGSFSVTFTVSTLIQGTTRVHGHNVPATYDCTLLNDCHIHVNSLTGGTVLNLAISFS